MDKVLIVTSDRNELNTIRQGFKELHHFELLTALNGKTAIDTLAQMSISVFVTDINLADMDGVELLAHMTRNHRATPCIVMLAPGQPRPWFVDRTGHEALLYYLEKPFEFGTLASMIVVGLTLKDEGQTRKGMTLKHFLPLIALSDKTCRMDVASGGKKKGFMYFHSGVLLDAIYNDKTGDAAAKEMAEWDGVTITFSELPAKRKARKIHTNLMDLAGATWKQKSPATAAPPPETGTTGQTKLETALRRHASVLRTIKGYLGLAVLNPEGEIIASDSAGEPVDFKAFSSEFNDLMAHCARTVIQKGFEQCSGFTVHTKKGSIIMMSSDVYKEGNYRFIGLMSPEGNGYFMQVQLEKIIPHILAAA